MQTSPFRPPPHYSPQIMVALGQPTDSTQEIVRAALAGAESIFRAGFSFARAGVMLLELQGREEAKQAELALTEEPGVARGGALMSAVDRLNDRYGRGTVAWGGGGRTQRAWAMRATRLTPAYTTNWADLPLARA